MAIIKAPGLIPIDRQPVNTTDVGAAKELRSLYFLKEDNKNRTEINLKNIIPDTLSYSYSPGFSSQNLLGRMSPIQIYTGGSSITYSFNVKLHEDYLENTKYTRLDDLVDDIKSLSYPQINSTGEVTLPKVLFQIGEISGYGLIQTSISWNKPFRNGRYILADLSFTITVEEILPAVTLEVSTTKIEDTSYNDYVYTGKSIVRSINAGNFITSPYSNYYNTNASDYVTYSKDGDFVQRNLDNLSNYIVERKDRLIDILNDMNMYDYKNKMLEQPTVGLISNLPITFSMVSSSSKSYKDFISSLESIKESFKTNLTEYYNNIDTNMTRDKYNAVLTNVYSIIDGIAGMYEAVMEYGAGS